jgi:hypothetical protein
VQLGLRQQDRSAELFLEDNGTGIDCEKALPQNAAVEEFGLAGRREDCKK